MDVALLENDLNSIVIRSHPSLGPTRDRHPLHARGTTAAAVFLDTTTVNDVYAMTGRIGPANVAPALSLAWLFIGSYILSLQAALYRAMVSLLPAGRALSIVTNTVARTVAEDRGAYNELFSVLLRRGTKLEKNSQAYC